MRSLLLLIIIIITSSVELFAQATNNNSTNAPVEKAYKQTLVQISPRMDIVIDKPRINIYLEGLYNTNGVYASIIEQTRWNIKPGIDWGITDKWYVGGSERINMNGFGVYNYTTQIYFQHRGKIGKTLFLKECIYEQYNFTDAGSTNTAGTTALTRRPAEGRFGLGIGFGRYIPVAANHIGVFVSYRPYIQFDFVQDGVAYYNKRFIDYTNLRIDAGYLINKSFYIGLYACRDTNFSYVPASDPYKKNTVTPVYGITCNVLLFVNPSAEKELSSFRYFYTK
jgi:hypothetical protein